MKINLTPFILARGLGLLADEMFKFAVPVALYLATGDLAWSGLAVIGLTLMRVLVLPWMASYVDRHRLRPQLLTSDAMRIGLTALFALTTQWHWVTVALAGVLALLNSYGFIILEKTVATHSSESELGRLQARLQTVEQVACVAGPAVGGLALHWGGLQIVGYMACAIFTLTLSALWFGFMPADDKPAPNKQYRLVDGLRVLWTNSTMAWLVGVSMASNLVEALIMTVAPMLFISLFHRTEADLGTFFSVSAAVSIIVLTILSLRRQVRIGRKASFGLLGGMALAALTIPLASNWLVFAGLYLAFIVMRSIFVIHVRTERAKAIPPAEFGKVLGIMIAMLQLPIPLSGLLVSMAARLDIRIDLLQWTCIGAVSVGCAWLWLFLRRRGSAMPKQSPATAPGQMP